MGSRLGRSAGEQGGGRSRAKLIGNGLRELDRFLSILLDEIAAEAGWSEEDLAPLARIRNTPNKLRIVGRRMNIESEHDIRLRALGRCRDALFHCDGLVRRGDARHATMLTLGWPAGADDETAAVLRMGDRLSVGLTDLKAIGALYIAIGDGLMRAAQRRTTAGML